RRRGHHCAPFRVPVRPGHHQSAAAVAGKRSAHSYRRSQVAHHRQGRHADDGRTDDPFRHGGFYAVVANPSNPYVWVVLWVTLGFGLVGFYDDYLKVTKQTHNAFPGLARIGIEALIAAVACALFVQLGRGSFSTSLVLPFFKELVINFGWFYVLFAIFIVIGAGNAVNLTDGLDGLAIVPVMIASASFGMIAYLSGNAVFADYLQIHYVAGTGELAVLCGAVVGAGLGFLWFNAPPASIFMGDTGSLALGGLIGAVAVATKHEIVLAVIGGLFVLEAVSVIVQVV